MWIILTTKSKLQRNNLVAIKTDFSNVNRCKNVKKSKLCPRKFFAWMKQQFFWSFIQSNRLMLKMLFDKLLNFSWHFQNKFVGHQKRNTKNLFYKEVYASLFDSLFVSLSLSHTHAYTHTCIYIYIQSYSLKLYNALSSFL